ncbi:MAG: DUF3089 domain-containing protein [Bacteroidetes bacterium]|nr:DUF3089 domain-containing protein [Bacteroidota bacterium]
MSYQRNLYLFPVLFIFFSCTPRYKSFQKQYDFKSRNGSPEYNNLNFWAAHPWKHDPSDSTPKPLLSEIKDSIADVFFIHPTTYTKYGKGLVKNMNAGIDNSFINAKTDYSTILYQASVFNSQCRVFAPRYRQAHLSAFFTKDTLKADKALELAYSDIKTAFEFYLKKWNQGRPIIIAGHSQGALLAEKLLKEFFENKPLKNQLVVAYIPGWPVPKEFFTSLKMCTDSLQTGCVCSWRTLKRNYLPRYIKKDTGNYYVTNPLTWTTDSGYASRLLNEGSVFLKFNKIRKNSTDAQVNSKKGILWIRKPKFPLNFLYPSKNYHPGDINIFYLNIRRNIALRIHSFQQIKNDGSKENQPDR